MRLDVCAVAKALQLRLHADAEDVLDSTLIATVRKSAAPPAINSSHLCAAIALAAAIIGALPDTGRVTFESLFTAVEHEPGSP